MSYTRRNTPDRTPATRSQQRTVARRNVLVFSSLVAALTLTSVLLMVVSPPPLSQDVASSLFAIDQPASLDAIFNTRTPVRDGRWKYIYIHHSRTPAGNALSLAQSGGLSDHFVIGNGDGCVDGEIQIGQRWDHQTPAAPPAGASQLDPACISICIIGDFDRGVPTQVQVRRITQLVNTLQNRFAISADRVVLIDHANSPAGIGRYFPSTAFRQQLLP